MAFVFTGETAMNATAEKRYLDLIDEESEGIPVPAGRLEHGKEYMRLQRAKSLANITDEMILAYRQWLREKDLKKSECQYYEAALEIMRNWYFRDEAEKLHRSTDLPDIWLAKRVCACLAAYGVREPDDVDVETRDRVKNYFQALAYKDLRSVMRFTDRIKFAAIKQKEKQPFSRRIITGMPKKVFLLYYPSYEAVRILYKTRKREELVFDMTRLAGDVIRRQFLAAINYIMHHVQGNNYYFSEYRAMALKELYDTAVEEGWQDIGMLLEKDEERHAKKMRERHIGNAMNYMQVLHMMRYLAFRDKEGIHWHATIWYLDQLSVEDYRENPSEQISILSFDGIERTENRVLLQEYALYMIGVTSLAFRTIRNRCYRLTYLMKYCDRKSIGVLTMSVEEFDEFFQIIEKENELTAYGFNRVLYIVFDFYQWLILHRKIDAVPFSTELFRKKEIAVHHDRSVGKEDQERTWNALLYFPETIRLMYLHLWTTGLRINEVCTLKAGNYYAKGGTFWLRVYQNKMRSEKDIPIPAELYQLMEQYIRKERRSADDYVFQDQKGDAYKIGAFRNQMKALCDQYGINTEEYHFRSHDYRHTVATGMYNEEIPLSAIRDFLGHQHSDMTKQYIDYIPEVIRKKSREYFEKHSFEEVKNER